MTVIRDDVLSAVPGRPLATRQMDHYQGQPITDRSVTVGTSAVGLVLPGLARSALVQVQGQPVRMRLSGVQPTDAVGVLWAAGDLFNILGREGLAAARFIRDAAATGDATLFVTFFD